MVSEDLRKTANVFKRIFNEHWEAFKKEHPRYNIPQYDEAVGKMLNCGMEHGGYTEFRCTECGMGIRRVPFSCKSCFCLSCCKVYVDDVVNQISKVLHPGMSYRHIVLTVPEQLRIHFYKDRHQGKLLSMFMQTGYKCLEDAISTALRKTVKIGCITVLQTHGRNGSYNPHLHIIMTSGGVDEKTGGWKGLYSINYDMLHKKWQYYLLRLMREWDSSKLMNELIDRLYKEYPKGFVANTSKGEAPQEARGLARYLAKYVASPPISVRRILSYDGVNVTYRYKDHKTKKEETVTVSVEVFIGRMVQHIMPKGFKRIRYYGLQAAKSYAKWEAIIRSSIKSIKGAYEVVPSPNYRERYIKGGGKDPLECPHCGGKMIVWKIWHPKYGVIFSEDEEDYGRRRSSA